MHEHLLTHQDGEFKSIVVLKESFFFSFRAQVRLCIYVKTPKQQEHKLSFCMCLSAAICARTWLNGCHIPWPFQGWSLRNAGSVEGVWNQAAGTVDLFTCFTPFSSVAAARRDQEVDQDVSKVSELFLQENVLQWWKCGISVHLYRHCPSLAHWTLTRAK